MFWFVDVQIVISKKNTKYIEKFLWEILTLNIINSNIFDSSFKSKSKFDFDDSNDQFMYRQRYNFFILLYEIIKIIKSFLIHMITNSRKKSKKT